MSKLVAILAEPYSQGEIARFEALIYASNNPAPKIRLSGRAELARFLTKHGTAKCDLMMAALDKHHQPKPCMDWWQKPGAK